MTTAQISRRMWDGVLSETVSTWHRPEDGPGEPGGRTYAALYTRSGIGRVDINDQSGSQYRTVWLYADDLRPRPEWLAHLRETGQPVPEERWCVVDGREIPADSDPEFDDGCCSSRCRAETLPDF